MSYWFLLAATVTVLDQATKYAAEASLVEGAKVALMPGLNLTLVYNPGAAFSLFAGAGDILAIVALAVSIALIVWIYRLPKHDRLTALALSALLGGALGNLWDRIFRDGRVVDFIDVYYQQWHWPAFNVADSAICLGAGALLLTSFFSSSEAASGKRG
ncbi:MAG: signal peptidase II [Gammaproteobacteria bacterium]|nr:signal peptidase II [Gammaproteobacteria bacterium]